MGKISVVINTWNEEKNLPRCIASVKGFADEIVVVDAMSSDDTVSVAKSYKAKVYLYTKSFTHVEQLRNFALNKATCNWILVLDADECLPVSLISSLKQISDNSEGDYYRLPRKNIIFGKWIKHSRWWPDYNIRFFRKGYVSWDEAIHSIPLTKGKGIDLEPKEENAIIHYHYQSIEQYIERMNRYTGVQAKNLTESGYKFIWSDLVKKPANEFLSRYFLGEGFRDGLHGFTLAGLQAVSEFMVYLKVWQTEKFKDQSVDLQKMLSLMKETESDFNYWKADALLRKNGGLKQRIKRKFRLP